MEQCIFNCSLPWDNETILGYYAEVIVNIASGDIHAAVVFTLLFLFVSICLHYQAFYKMFKYWVDEWNDKKRCSSNEKFICDLIRFQILVKE